MTGMEIGAVFIFIVFLIVLAILGGGLYAITMWLRHRQLHSEEDKLQGPAEKPAGQARPEHVRHGRAQRARFLGNH